MSLLNLWGFPIMKMMTAATEMQMPLAGIGSLLSGRTGSLTVFLSSEKLSCANGSLRKQSRAEQSRAEQSRAEQSRAEQSRAEQSRALSVFFIPTGSFPVGK